MIVLDGEAVLLGVDGRSDNAETIRAEMPIARRYQATIFQIGKWRRRTGITSLAEIAAGSFAQACYLPCHPKVLDFVACDGIGTGTRPLLVPELTST